MASATELARRLRQVPVRKLEAILDLDNPTNAVMSLSAFRKMSKDDPNPPRYRLIQLDLAVCPEDGQPVLASECGQCPKFFRRYDGCIQCGDEARETT